MAKVIVVLQTGADVNFFYVNAIKDGYGGGTVGPLNECYVSTTARTAYTTDAHELGHTAKCGSLTQLYYSQFGQRLMYYTESPSKGRLVKNEWDQIH